MPISFAPYVLDRHISPPASKCDEHGPLCARNQQVGDPRKSPSNRPAHEEAHHAACGVNNGVHILNLAELRPMRYNQKAMTMKYLSLVGLAMTALGIIVGFYWPTTAARWSGPDTLAQEYLLQVRYFVGTALVVLGTMLQMVAVWRQRP